MKRNLFFYILLFLFLAALIVITVLIPWRGRNPGESREADRFLREKAPFGREAGPAGESLDAGETPGSRDSLKSPGIRKNQDGG